MKGEQFDIGSILEIVGGIRSLKGKINKITWTLNKETSKKKKKRENFNSNFKKYNSNSIAGKFGGEEVERGPSLAITTNLYIGAIKRSTSSKFESG